MYEHRTTTVDGVDDPRDRSDASWPRERAGVRDTARALVRLARARRRLAHVPTVGQVRAMARFDGVEPCSYLLDRAVNFVPEPMEFGYECEVGHHALSFTCRDRTGG